MSLDSIVSKAWKSVRRTVSNVTADAWHWLKENTAPVRKKIGWATFGALSVGSLDYNTQKFFHRKHKLWEPTSFWLGMAVGNTKKYLLYKSTEALNVGVADSLGLYFALTVASDIARVAVYWITGKVQPTYIGMWSPVAAAITITRRSKALTNAVDRYWPPVAKQAYKVRDYGVERAYQAWNATVIKYRQLTYTPRLGFAS